MLRNEIRHILGKSVNKWRFRVHFTSRLPNTKFIFLFPILFFFTFKQKHYKGKALFKVKSTMYSALFTSTAGTVLISVNRNVNNRQASWLALLSPKKHYALRNIFRVFSM